MTVIENLTPRVQYTVTDAEETSYSIGFTYTDKTQVKVMLNNTLLEYAVQYTVPNFDPISLSSNQLNITLLITPPDIKVGDIITIYRNTPIDQQTEFPQEARFSSQKITEALDKLTQINQEQADDLTQCLRLAKNLPIDFNTMLPFPEANQVIQWNEDGTQLINYDLRGEIAEFEEEVEDTIDEFKDDVNEAIEDFKTEVNDEIDTFKTEVAEDISEISTEVGTANTTAQAAESKADTAVGTANSASSTADEAKTIASTASTNASTALSTANTASTNASTALSTANTAKSTADATSAKVDEFEEDIEVVIEAAEAIGDLDEKITTATEAASTATTAATNATSAATSATTAATSATTAAQTATAKAQEAAQSAATFKQSDWNQTVSTESDYIKNKPTVVKTVNNNQPDANGNVTIQTGGTVDQTYDSTSENAQSGIAINGANFLQNIATYTGAITIGVEATPATTNYATNIGKQSQAIAIGNTAFGGYARATGPQSTQAYGATAIGNRALASGSDSTALGGYASATQTNAIQIGEGTNNTSNSLQIGSYQLLDTSTGLIPDARLNLKTINGNSIKGSGDISVGGGLPSQTGHSGDLLTTDGTDASWVNTAEVYPVIAPYINGSSWYRISAPDNTGYRWCEMGGLYYLGSTMAATDNTITFLKTFKDLKYTFVAFAMHSDAAVNLYQMFEKYTLRTKTSTVLRITSAQFGYEWIAKGYIENEN